MKRLWTTTSAGQPDRTRRREPSPIRPGLLIENAVLYHWSNASLLRRSPASRRYRRDARWPEATRDEGCQHPATSLPSRVVLASQCVPVAGKIARLWPSVRLSAWQSKNPRSGGPPLVPLRPRSGHATAHDGRNVRDGRALDHRARQRARTPLRAATERAVRSTTRARAYWWRRDGNILPRTNPVAHLTGHRAIATWSGAADGEVYAISNMWCDEPGSWTVGACSCDPGSV